MGAGDGTRERGCGLRDLPEKFRIRDTLGQPRKGTKADARGGGCEKRKVSLLHVALGRSDIARIQRGAPCTQPGAWSLVCAPAACVVAVSSANVSPFIVKTIPRRSLAWGIAGTAPEMSLRSGKIILGRTQWPRSPPKVRQRWLPRLAYPASFAPLRTDDRELGSAPMRHGAIHNRVCV